MQSRAGVPAGFLLQDKSRIVAFRIVNSTFYHAKSAEAEVEGFQAGDYAVVMAQKVKKAWVARNIYFDVHPIYALNQITVSGTIQKVSTDGKRFVLRAPARQYRWVVTSRKTKFRLDGQLAGIPPVLTKGQTVQVVMHRAGLNWLAFEVNLKTAPSLRLRRLDPSPRFKLPHLRLPLF